jgi:hypothetical protein
LNDRNVFFVDIIEADLNSAGSNVSSTLAASWAGWAVTSLAAKFYRSKPSTEQKANSSQSTTTSSKENTGILDKEKSEDRPQTPLTPNIQKSESGESMPDFDEEVWGSIDTTNNQSNTNKKSLDGWDSEEWNDFDSNDRETSNQSVRKNSLVKDEGQEFFDKFSATNKTSKNAKSDDWANEETESDWNNWNEGKESDVKLSSSTKISAVSNEENKIKAEERRQQRFKGLEERKARKATKGPMKLGAQRIT